MPDYFHFDCIVYKGGDAMLIDLVSQEGEFRNTEFKFLWVNDDAVLLKLL